MVDEWIRLAREARERDRRRRELGAVIRAYAEEHGLFRLFGSDGAVDVAEAHQADDSRLAREVRAMESLTLRDIPERARR